MSKLESRMSDPTKLIPESLEIAAATVRPIRNGPIPQALVDLMQLRVGQLVGSTYFTVMMTANLRKAGESEERITSVASWRTSPYFTDAERIAFELAEAVHTPNPAGERVPDELHARAAALYDDKALWTLIFALGQIGYFVPAALIGKPIPGTPPGKGYTK